MLNQSDATSHEVLVKTRLNSVGASCSTSTVLLSGATRRWFVAGMHRPVRVSCRRKHSFYRKLISLRDKKTQLASNASSTIRHEYIKNIEMKHPADLSFP